MFVIRWICVVLFLTGIHPDFCHAQFGGGQGGGGQGGGGGGQGGGQGGGGNGGGNQNNASGIKIDADGIVTLSLATDASGSLDKKRRESLARAHRSQDANQATKSRFVSLVGLEKRLEELSAELSSIPNELFYLAGLQRIEHVFVFPDEGDVVIAGPAEGFVPDATGRMIGVESGRPTLRLDDLYVAMRTLTKSKHLGCSIDPVPKRLAELRSFIQQGVPATVDEVEARFNQMDDLLGFQDVRIDGVPEDSHFATILVEADYRMKRIAIGVEAPAIKGLKSHLAMLGTAGNAMQRWWFLPLYDGIYRSRDGLAFQLVGQRAQLVAEDEIADSLGNRSTAPTTRKSTQAFAKQFTEKFAQLADKSPSFAELQNLIDWATLVALFEREHIPQRIGWKKGLLHDENRLPHPMFVTPKKIPSSVNYKRVGNQVVGLVGGGVIINPRSVLEGSSFAAKNSEDLEATRASAGSASRPESHQWWWDEMPTPKKKVAVKRN